MNIKYRDGDHFDIRAKEGKITLKSGVDIDGFMIEGPGEYEREGIFVEGMGPDKEEVFFIIRAEDITLCYPKNVTKLPKDSIIKHIGDVDILFVPLGKDGTLDYKKSHELISKVDPRVVIPMQYEDLTKFKDKEGTSDGEVDTYKIKKNDLPSDERHVVIIKPKK